MSDNAGRGDGKLAPSKLGRGQSLDKIQKKKLSMDYELHDDFESMMSSMIISPGIDLVKSFEAIEAIGEHSSTDNENDNVRPDDASPEDKKKSAKPTKSAESFDYDSDDDSFACAESDCEPNQFYLAEMLEDVHPERLNLFDYKRAASVNRINKENAKNSNSYLDQSLHASTRKVDTDYDNDHEKLGRKDDLIPGYESDSDEGDSFDCVPKIIGNGRARRSSLGSTGSAGPGRPMLRQPSQKAVWGK